MDEDRALLAGLLRHEAKANTYKFALVRALNDLALEHPLEAARDVVVPLRRVAERWLVFYWPFVGNRPVYQGARATRDGQQRQDISFREALTTLRGAWEALPHTRADPADGALLLAAYRAGRGQLPPALQAMTVHVLGRVARAVRQPVRYAGPGGQHGVFSPPAAARDLAGQPLPGTLPEELAFTVPGALWGTLQAMSLWVEALCVHEWSLFVERVEQAPAVTRGEVFSLLSASPAARLPLTWERHHVRLLMLEGQGFHCPWTGTRLVPGAFDLDHIIPVSVHPINELWNLVPSDPAHNMHVKRDRIPNAHRLGQALPELTATYQGYGQAAPLAQALEADASARFGLPLAPPLLARRVVQMAAAVAEARNVPRY
ncbi:HNH endonuclease [Deinococcus budaensis]|nr:HNH endonuclease signature motif containing protein [Deinococcus budaensis]